MKEADPYYHFHYAGWRNITVCLRVACACACLFNQFSYVLCVWVENNLLMSCVSGLKTICLCIVCLVWRQFAYVIKYNVCLSRYVSLVASYFVYASLQIQSSLWMELCACSSILVMKQLITQGCFRVVLIQHSMENIMLKTISSNWVA